jgi:hypothetical protein
MLFPEVGQELINRYGEQNFSLEYTFDKAGGKKMIQNMIFRHAEKNFLHQAINVEDHAGGAPGAAVTLTLVAAMDYDYPEIAPAAPYAFNQQDQTIPLYDNMVVRFGDGSNIGVSAFVSGCNPAAGTFVVTPRVTGDSIPAVTTADNIIITGNQVPDGADLNDSRDTQLIWYTNNMKNSNWTYRITGNAKVERTWFNDEGSWTWFFTGQMDEMARAKNEKAWTVLTDVRTTNVNIASGTYDDGGNVSTLSFEGMIPFIDLYGSHLLYSGITGMTRQDFENLILTQLLPAVAPVEFAVWSAGSPTTMKDEFMRDNFKNGGIVYGFFGQNEEQYANFQFNSFCLSGKSFHWKHMADFDYAPALGAAGQGYNSMFLGLPLRKSNKTVDWDDMTATKNLPDFVINHQGGEGYSREWEEFKIGGINGTYTEGKDRLIVAARSTYGFEGFAANQYFIGQQE